MVPACSCSSSYHSADSSSGNSSNGEGTSSSSSDESTTSSSSRGKDMAIMFTCGKCDTRSVKAFSKHSYDKGLVSAAAATSSPCVWVSVVALTVCLQLLDTGTPPVPASSCG